MSQINKLREEIEVIYEDACDCLSLPSDPYTDFLDDQRRLIAMKLLRLSDEELIETIKENQEDNEYFEYKYLSEKYKL